MCTAYAAWRQSAEGGEEEVVVVLWTSDQVAPPVPEWRMACPNVVVCNVWASTDEVCVMDEEAVQPEWATPGAMSRLLSSRAVAALLAGHSNVCVVAPGFRRGEFVLQVGVVAKGCIPLGETEFPKIVNVALGDGSSRVVPVDVCRGWFQSSCGTCKRSHFMESNSVEVCKRLGILNPSALQIGSAVSLSGEGGPYHVDTGRTFCTLGGFGRRKVDNKLVAITAGHVTRRSGRVGDDLHRVTTRIFEDVYDELLEDLRCDPCIDEMEELRRTFAPRPIGPLTHCLHLNSPCEAAATDPAWATDVGVIEVREESWVEAGVFAWGRENRPAIRAGSLPVMDLDHPDTLPAMMAESFHVAKCGAVSRWTRGVFDPGSPIMAVSLHMLERGVKIGQTDDSAPVAATPGPLASLVGARVAVPVVGGAGSAVVTVPSAPVTSPDPKPVPSSELRRVFAVRYGDGGAFSVPGDSGAFVYWVKGPGAGELSGVIGVVTGRIGLKRESLTAVSPLAGPLRDMGIDLCPLVPPSARAPKRVPDAARED